MAPLTRPITMLDLNDIQRLAISGYSRHPHAAFILLTITEDTPFRKWLSTLDITHCGARSAAQYSINIAFTSEGLKQLTPPETWQHFSREFTEGMVTPHRQRVLGDLDGSVNDPENWNWGNAKKPPVHLCLFLYADTTTILNHLIEEHVQTSNGLTEVTTIRTHTLKEQKEHFGFRDGIANPQIRELAREGDKDLVAAGEFILGHPDEDGSLTPVPQVNGAEDWGLNGSYLVMRQISQNVVKFWEQIQESLDAKPLRSKDPIWLASKMVGRWPNGAPLVTHPEYESKASDSNNFYYTKKDPHGERCPFHAHIRRCNPRDSLGDDPELSLQLNQQHRILRRGRAYGPPLEHPAIPVEARVELDAEPTVKTDDRGLVFICLNTNIAEQFEFIQNTWVNNPKFMRGIESIDPITGQPVKPNDTTSFVIPGAPAHQRVCDWELPVQVKGGAYFFMPSLSAIKHLTQVVK